MSIDRSLQVGGTILSLVGGGLIFLFPEKRWIGWSSIAAGVLILLGAAVWMIASRYAVAEYRRANRTVLAPAPSTQSLSQNAPITNTNSPVFAPVFAPNFSHAQSQQQHFREPSPPPVIKPLPVTIRRTSVTPYGEVTDDPVFFQQPNEKLPVAVAELRRGADSCTEIVDGRASVTFTENVLGEFHRINDAHCLSLKDTTHVFNLGICAG